MPTADGSLNQPGQRLVRSPIFTIGILLQGAVRPPRPNSTIYAFLTRNAVRAPDYFLIPTPQVVELGTKVEL